MNEDFASAAARHYCDSELLLAKQRLDNAAYLAGYAVECGLKALILHAGGHPRAAYSHNLSALAGKALELAVLLSPAMRRYYIDTIDEMLDASRDWDPALRYAASGQTAPAKAKDLGRAARMSFERILIPMILDGRIEIPR